MKDMEEKRTSSLALIPKYENYMEYMLDYVLVRLPRTEKFSIGTEYKKIMYETLTNIVYIEKVIKKERLYYLNKIDAGLNVQRILLRVMKKQRWMDEKKFNYVMNNLIAEVGQILGGLIRYYAKNS